MAKNIEPTLKLISKYLKLEKSENFVIPEYQRAYSWGITQCDKLWQDIEAFIDSDANDPYFFGTIIVNCSETDKFHLIDGQQRTTTFLLLLKALLLQLIKAIPNVRADEESRNLEAGLKGKINKIMAILYKAEDEDIPDMLDDSAKIQGIVVLENKSINELFPDEIKTIIEAPDFKTAEQNVHKIPRKQKDNKYTNFFRNFKFFFEKLGEKSESQLNQFARIFLEKCQVIEIRSWQIEQAITMFNSLNSTGMPLSDADIISAQLYSYSGDNKSEFNKQWGNINTLASQLSSLKIIDINGALQQFMYINRAIDRNYISINQEGKESVNVTTPGLRRYYTELEKDLLKEPLALCENLTRIIEIWNTIKDYPTVKLLLKCNENAKLFLSGYLYRYKATEITKENILGICECLLRLFTVLELSDAGYSSSKFKTFLFGENIKFVDKTVSIDAIIADFNDHIKKNWKQDVVKEAIMEYEKNLLVFINEYIYAKNKSIPFDFSDSVNIEHIMPASGRYLPMIRQDAKIEDEDEFNSIVNKLGNKILLEEDINKSIGNEWFKAKKQNSINIKSGYKDSRYGIANALTTYPNDTWTKEDIVNATENAAERIMKFIFNEE